jgi:hypothetical protein
MAALETVSRVSFVAACSWKRNGKTQADWVTRRIKWKTYEL